MLKDFGSWRKAHGLAGAVVRGLGIATKVIQAIVGVGALFFLFPRILYGMNVERSAYSSHSREVDWPLAADFLAITKVWPAVLTPAVRTSKSLLRTRALRASLVK